MARAGVSFTCGRARLAKFYGRAARNILHATMRVSRGDRSACESNGGARAFLVRPGNEAIFEGNWVILHPSTARTLTKTQTHIPDVNKLR